MHGTRYDHHGGRLTRVTDRRGAIHAELTWFMDTDRLVRLVVPGATVEGEVVDHPLLGDAHRVGETAMTALDFMRPTEIPTIAAPSRLRPGAGGAILNAIALLARHAGVAALRYAGPYPTAALWRSLCRSFRCGASEDAFTADAVDRAVRIARDPIPIDFAPAPHERVAIGGGVVELRDRIERVVLDGQSYEPGGSPARLVSPPDIEPAGSAAPARSGDATGGPRAPSTEPGSPVTGHYHCEIWFGDRCHARVATLSAGGDLVAGPHPIPPYASPVLGHRFPAPLCDALADLVADAVPPPLAADVRALCACSDLRWADLGAGAARELPGGFAVHAALWDRIAPLGLARLALALAEALAPVMAAAVVRRASAQARPPR